MPEPGDAAPVKPPPLGPDRAALPPPGCPDCVDGIAVPLPSPAPEPPAGSRDPDGCAALSDGVVADVPAAGDDVAVCPPVPDPATDITPPQRLQRARIPDGGTLAGSIR